MPAKSSWLARNTVVFTSLSIRVPAASRIARMLVSTCAVCSWMVVPTTSPAGEREAGPTRRRDRRTGWPASRARPAAAPGPCRCERRTWWWPRSYPPQGPGCYHRACVTPRVDKLRGPVVMSWPPPRRPGEPGHPKEEFMGILRPLAVAAVLWLLGAFAPSAQAETTLRVVLHSDLDHGLHRPQPRLPELRHVVRHGRQGRHQAADGRQVRGEQGPAHVHDDPARRARLARRQAGHRRGLRGLDQALGGQGLDGPEDDGLRQGAPGRQPEDLPGGAHRADRPRPRRARQALLQRAVHDAQARG